MDNVLQDMVQRLRAIELLLRTQNELLTGVLAELVPGRCEERKVGGVLPAPAELGAATTRLPTSSPTRTAKGNGQGPGEVSWLNRRSVANPTSR
jgi:hypothetical protein